MAQLINVRQQLRCASCGATEWFDTMPGGYITIDDAEAWGWYAEGYFDAAGRPVPGAWQQMFCPACSPAGIGNSLKLLLTGVMLLGAAARLRQRDRFVPPRMHDPSTL